MKVYVLIFFLLVGANFFDMDAAYQTRGKSITAASQKQADEQEGAYDQLPKWNYTASIYAATNMSPPEICNFESRMHKIQLDQADEILHVAAIIRVSQTAAKKQELDIRGCIAIKFPSMAFICTCREHKVQYSSFKN